MAFSIGFKVVIMTFAVGWLGLSSYGWIKRGFSGSSSNQTLNCEDSQNSNKQECKDKKLSDTFYKTLRSEF